MSSGNVSLMVVDSSGNRVTRAEAVTPAQVESRYELPFHIRGVDILEIEFDHPDGVMVRVGSGYNLLRVIELMASALHNDAHSSGIHVELHRLNGAGSPVIMPERIMPSEYGMNPLMADGHPDIQAYGLSGSRYLVRCANGADLEALAVVLRDNLMRFRAQFLNPPRPFEDTPAARIKKYLGKWAIPYIANTSNTMAISYIRQRLNGLRPPLGCTIEVADAWFSALNKEQKFALSHPDMAPSAPIPPVIPDVPAPATTTIPAPVPPTAPVEALRPPTMPTPDDAPAPTDPGAIRLRLLGRAHLDPVQWVLDDSGNLPPVDYARVRLGDAFVQATKMSLYEPVGVSESITGTSVWTRRAVHSIDRIHLPMEALASPDGMLAAILENVRAGNCRTEYGDRNFAHTVAERPADAGNPLTAGPSLDLVQRRTAMAYAAQLAHQLRVLDLSCDLPLTLARIRHLANRLTQLTQATAEMRFTPADYNTSQLREGMYTLLNLRDAELRHHVLPPTDAQSPVVAIRCLESYILAWLKGFACGSRCMLAQLVINDSHTAIRLLPRAMTLALADEISRDPDADWAIPGESAETVRVTLQQFAQGLAD